MTSQARQNYHQDVEAGINKQINLELYASYVYLSIAHYFDRDDVALPGFHAFYKKSSDEEREHAEKLMRYQNQRGGRLVLADVQKPARDSWGSALDTLQTSLELEKSVNQSLLDLHGVGASHGDEHFTDFIEGEFLGEQVEGIKKIADMVTQLKRSGTGLGEYLFDKELQEKAS